jgi:hypothetical protein
MHQFSPRREWTNKAGNPQWLPKPVLTINLAGPERDVGKNQQASG